MRLIDYMTKEGLDDETFARAFNKGLPVAEHVTAAGVKKWKYGERQPPADRIIRIKKITDGKVRLEDWASEERAAS